MAELSRISSPSDRRVILASLWFLYCYTQSSGSGEEQVDVEAGADLGIDVRRFHTQLYLAFWFFTPFMAKEA